MRVRSGIPTAIIAERYKAGESIDDLARDYDRERDEIPEAIRCELHLAAAARHRLLRRPVAGSTCSRRGAPGIGRTCGAARRSLPARCARRGVAGRSRREGLGWVLTKDEHIRRHPLEREALLGGGPGRTRRPSGPVMAWPSGRTPALRRVMEDIVRRRRKVAVIAAVDRRERVRVLAKGRRRGPLRNHAREHRPRGATLHFGAGFRVLFGLFRGPAGEPETRRKSLSR